MMHTLAETDGGTLRVEVRLKNARLIDAIYAYPVPILSRNPAGRAAQRRPIAGFCRLHELGYMAVTGLCTLRVKPLITDGPGETRPQKTAERLSEILDRPLAWLFPADLYEIAWPRAFAANVSPERFVALLDAPASVLALPSEQDETIMALELRSCLSAVLKTLLPREERILRARFWGEKTIAEIAVSEGVSRERIFRLEVRALRKMRHPSRSTALKPWRD